MSIKVQKGIPVPEGDGRPRVYPFDRMKVGDSFVLSAEESKLESRRQSVLNSARRQGVKITTRIESGKVRVWRKA